MDIDFVIIWVDGSDKKWLQEKNKYQKNSINIDAEINRYRDWDNLKYWFRGVEKYAPWVNKIFFVTCGQCPDWLNTKHEKLVMVNHEDYIPSDYLPTFSSHPIELNLHRIKGLSEHFVYFNDDMFITGKSLPTDFFSSDGLPCDLFVEEPPTFVKKDVFNNIIINNLILVNSKFDRQEVLNKNKKKIYSTVNKKVYIKNKIFSLMKRHEFFGIEFSHLPQPFLKSMFDEVWSENYDVLDEVCKNKFRSIDDVNQYVVKYYQLLKGKFEPYNWKRKGIAFQLDDIYDNNIEEACKCIASDDYNLVCLNDSKIKNFDKTKGIINNIFEKKFSEKSKFEID